MNFKRFVGPKDHVVIWKEVRENVQTRPGLRDYFIPPSFFRLTLPEKTAWLRNLFPGPKRNVEARSDRVNATNDKPKGICGSRAAVSDDTVVVV